MIARDLELAIGLCAERAGLRVDPEKPYLLENRLAPVARREGFGSVEEMMAAVRDRDEDRLIWAIVEAMSPSESSFFGDPETFELIAEKVLPALAHRRDSGPIRVWAAACGTGQEIYSLAMLLAEHPPAGTTVELTGSDICERRLEKAQSGLYSQFEVQRGLSAHRLVRHFENAEDGFVLSPRLRQQVRWRRLNPIEDLRRLGQFDLVLCRNLAAALTELARERLLANLTAALAPGGFLVLGRGERAAGLSSPQGLPGFHVRANAQRAAA
ncbi:MAG: CheR family methyltransferase [Phenylobacterium sp.]